MARPTIDELQRREEEGRAEKVEGDRYRIVVDVSDSKAWCDIMKIVPDGVEDEHDRFMVKGDPNGDPKHTMLIALLAARDRAAGHYHPSIVEKPPATP
jgi:hypothetical protein